VIKNHKKKEERVDQDLLAEMAINAIIIIKRTREKRNTAD
jgi:hypothetical protein